MDYQILQAVLYLKGDVYTKFEPYLAERLFKGASNLYNPAVTEVFISINKYIKLLAQIYKNLDEKYIIKI